MIGVDLYPREDSAYEKMHALSEMDNCLAQADVVVLTLPLTDETKRMFNEARFGAMKGGAVFVNIARGAIVEETALLKALDEKLSGAVLDVFEEEPLAINSPLWKKENVIITPHNSFVGDGNGQRLSALVFKNLKP